MGIKLTRHRMLPGMVSRKISNCITEFTDLSRNVKPYWQVAVILGHSAIPVPVGRVGE